MQTHQTLVNCTPYVPNVAITTTAVTEETMTTTTDESTKAITQRTTSVTTERTPNITNEVMSAKPSDDSSLKTIVIIVVIIIWVIIILVVIAVLVIYYVIYTNRRKRSSTKRRLVLKPSVKETSNEETDTMSEGLCNWFWSVIQFNFYSTSKSKDGFEWNITAEECLQI